MATTTSLANSANAIKRHHGANSAEYIEAKRKHAVASIEDAIRRNLADAPPLDDEQFARLTVLLRGGAR